MRSLTRHVAAVLVLFSLSSAIGASEAFAGVYGGVGSVNHVGGKSKGSSTTVDEDNLESVAFIEGAPAEKVCQTRTGRAVVVSVGDPVPQTWTEDYWRDIPDSDPPAREHVVITHTKFYFQEVKLTCGSGTWTTIRCTPAENACPPPKPKPDPFAVGKRMVRTIGWGSARPRFAPDWRKTRKYPFVIANAPMFFWFPTVDWYDRESESQACNGDQCVVARVEARPVAAVFDSGSEGSSSCPYQGDEVLSESQYVAARERNECMFTYAHSSTLQTGNVYKATAWIEFEIWIQDIDGVMVREGGDNWGIDTDVNVPVGEVQGVSTR